MLLSLVGRLAAAWREFIAEMIDPYRPELHYMRGPGPKWHAKHDPVRAPKAVATPAMIRWPAPDLLEDAIFMRRQYWRAAKPVSCRRCAGPGLVWAWSWQGAGHGFRTGDYGLVGRVHDDCRREARFCIQS